MADEPQVIENAANKDFQSMRGKYDERGKWKRIKGQKNSGRKPLFAKHLSRNTAAKLFVECDVKAKLKQCLSATTWVSQGRNAPMIEVPDMRLQFEVARYLWDRFEGRPFVAENPAIADKPAALHQDNRLQLAINQLILPAKAPQKARKSRAKALPGAQELASVDVDAPQAAPPAQDVTQG